MSRLKWALVGVAIVVLGLNACAAREPLPPPAAEAGLEESPARAFVEALRPQRTGRPVVAVLALNEGTETTDFLLPHAVLRRAGVAEVQAVAPRRGPVRLYPALQVEVDQSLADFDRLHPAGADYVIVPALHEDDDPAVTAWLRRQQALGARVIEVCAGALVLGRAGLLAERRFVTHWYYRDKLQARHPGATFVPHQRYVVDRGVATTTGITASVPAMLALVEALGGRERAQAVAAELGVATWSPAHDSRPFGLDAGRRRYALTRAAFWRHERWSVEVHEGMDDVALALAADAWTRTGRVSVEAVSPSGPVRLRSGLLLTAQPAFGTAPRLPLAPELPPVRQLDRTLCEIAARFGAERRDWVMQELEYPGPAAACPGAS
ncbi:DJ-1/PfpI family protein [uncultured Azohydromonas sp.]|jgi:Transcriptional regulator containing an amidase domain and an AraC-type DNA-binding HTH domain|uniref:DJ-1/PfpI family protein n=1 Tax=uncultured Azohydromonas sp. TaxID=487342 RepID=UPI002618B865|nr:DJ-1/PfpI family protein [uncultured Azohydromonas sp.]